jgi:hypothetical protein
MLPNKKKAIWMAIPGIHSNLKNREKEIALQKINRNRERQKTGIRKPAGTGKKFSKMIPEINGNNNLQNGASFQDAYCSDFLIRMGKIFRFLRIKKLNCQFLQSFRFFYGVFLRCFNGIFTR